MQRRLNKHYCIKWRRDRSHDTSWRSILYWNLSLSFVSIQTKFCRYKQKGPAAVEANNVFHHFTYEGSVDMDTIKDPLQKEAAEIAVNEFGQCPKQLFETPHARRLVCPSSADAFAISTAASSGEHSFPWELEVWDARLHRPIDVHVCRQDDICNKVRKPISSVYFSSENLDLLGLYPRSAPCPCSWQSVSAVWRRSMTCRKGKSKESCLWWGKWVRSSPVSCADHTCPRCNNGFREQICWSRGGISIVSYCDSTKL